MEKIGFLFCYRTMFLNFTSADDASKRGRQKYFDMMMPEFQIWDK